MGREPPDSARFAAARLARVRGPSSRPVDLFDLELVFASVSLTPCANAAHESCDAAVAVRRAPL